MILDMPRWEKVVYVFLITLSIAVGVYELSLFRNYMVDDAFISLRYVRNALEGHGLVYNVGEKVEGFTSPLHVLLNYILGVLGVDLVVGSKILGTISFLLILVFLASWSLIPNKTRPLNLPEFSVTFSIIASSFSLTFFAITGMETVIFSLLTLLLFLDATRFQITSKSIFLMVVAFLCRPEAITFILWILLALFITRRHNSGSAHKNGTAILNFRRNELACIGVFLLFVMIFLVARWTYFGELLPNTFFAKAPWTTEGGKLHYSLKGIGPLIYFFNTSGGILGILIFLSALPTKRGSFGILVLVGVMTSALICFHKYTGGDWMIGSRYLIPALPVWALGVGISLNSLNIVGTSMLPLFRCVTVGLTIAAIAAMNVSNATEFVRNIGSFPNNVQTSIGLRDIGLWIRDNVPEEFRVRNWRIGAIGYYCDNPIMDTWGLVNKEISRLRFGASSEEQGNKLVQAHVSKLAPEILITTLRKGVFEEPNGYRLVHEGKNGNEKLGVWVRNDVASRIRQQPPQTY